VPDLADNLTTTPLPARPARGLKGRAVAGNEPVTSPDQHKPGQAKASRIGAILVIISLLAMTQGNHRGFVENYWLLAVAGFLLLILVGDWLLRKNGLRS
jgi:hypothetical protein